MGRLQYYRNRLVPFSDWDSETKSFSRCWTEWKHAEGYKDFTDLLEDGLHSGEQHPDNPACGFLDEGQDCTPLQLELFRLWGRSMKYTEIAFDDDQSIYSYMGAEPELLLKSNPDRKNYLTQSYRLPRSVAGFSSRFISRCSVREKKTIKPRDTEGKIIRAPICYKYPEEVHLWMRKYQGTILILASCGYMLWPMMSYLRDEGIPFCNPYRTSRTDWNPLRTSSVSRLIAFLAPDGNRLWTRDEFGLWAEHVESAFVFHPGKKEEAIKFAGKDDMTLKDLLNLIPEKILGKLLNMKGTEAATWYARNTIQSKRESYEYPLKVYRRFGMDGLQKEPSIRLGTIHSAKGGQADNVILFPDLSRQGMMCYSGTQKERDSVIRQLYVGMTRAYDTLVLADPSGVNFVEV
jgi:DNA helicase-2/ATP-dependent DNA helicase PcrA